MDFVLAIYFDDSSLTPTFVYSIYSVKLLEKNENK